MTRERTLGILISGLGVLVLLVPRLLFPVCGVGPYVPAAGVPSGVHGCTGSLIAETVLGSFIVACGLVAVAFPRRTVSLFAAVCASLFGVLVIMFPLVFTGMCKASTMPCVFGTTPALVSAGIVVFLTGGAALVLVAKKRR